MDTSRDPAFFVTGTIPDSHDLPDRVPGSRDVAFPGAGYSDGVHRQHAEIRVFDAFRGHGRARQIAGGRLHIRNLGQRSAAFAASREIPGGDKCTFDVTELGLHPYGLVEVPEIIGIPGQIGSGESLPGRIQRTHRHLPLRYRHQAPRPETA